MLDSTVGIRHAVLSTDSAADYAPWWVQACLDRSALCRLRRGMSQTALKPLFILSMYSILILSIGVLRHVAIGLAACDWEFMPSPHAPFTRFLSFFLPTPLPVMEIHTFIATRPTCQPRQDALGTTGFDTW